MVTPKCHLAILLSPRTKEDGAYFFRFGQGCSFGRYTDRFALRLRLTRQQQSALKDSVSATPKNLNPPPKTDAAPRYHSDTMSFNPLNTDSLLSSWITKRSRTVAAACHETILRHYDANPSASPLGSS
jgi:hypothetical protein